MLKKKLIRDLKAEKAQFISIFLMIFLGITIYTGLNVIGAGMDKSSKDFYKETNLADAIVYGTDFDMSAIDKISVEADIDNVEGRVQIDATYSEDSGKVLQVNYISSNRISSVKVMSGSEYSQDTDGAWVSQEFAAANNLKVGDDISYTYGGVTETKSIEGLIMHPEYVFAVKDEASMLPDYDNYGYIFVPENYGTLCKDGYYNQLLLDTDLGKEELQKVLGTVSEVLLMQEDYSSVNMFAGEVSQMKAMQMVFPVIFLLVAVLTVLSTMTRITVGQRQQIGILKALGFSNKRILLHYTCFGVWVSLIGSILGSVAGIVFFSKLTFSMQKTMYSLPEWKISIQPVTFIIVALCVTLCGLCGVFACKKQLAGATAQILRPKPMKAASHSFLESTKWWSKRNFDVQWNVRDLRKGRLKGFITIFGIMGCMALILCALGMKDTTDDLVNEAYSQLNTYETKVTLKPGMDQQILASDMADKANQFFMEQPIEVIGNGEAKTTVLTVVSEGHYTSFRTEYGKKAGLSDAGCYITRKLADSMGVKEGDEIEYRIYGTEDMIRARVSEIVVNPIGQGIYFSKQGYEEIKQIFVPTYFVSDKDYNCYNTDNYEAIQSMENIKSSVNGMMEMMNTIIAIMIGAAALLGAVVLYNLGAMAFYERVRELATLKVLGFQFKRLARLTQMQNIWLTLAGILAGIPMGYGLLYFMLQFMGESYDMTAYITITSYIISVIGTFGLSVGVNWLLSRKLKTIDMVSALKSVE